MIFCLFFLENNVLEAHKIAQREKTQNNISFVAILEKISVPRLVANINVIINAYDLDNIFFNIKNINMIPKVVINDIGVLTISVLIFSKAKQDKLISQKSKGE